MRIDTTVPDYDHVEPLGPMEAEPTAWLRAAFARLGPADAGRVSSLVPVWATSVFRIEHVSYASEGLLPPVEGASLLWLLSGLTASERCFLAVWEGFGSHRSAPRRAPGRRDRLGSMEYFVYRGALAAWDAFHGPGDPPPFQSANYWWPEDRRWLVASPVDLAASFVAVADEADATAFIEANNGLASAVSPVDLLVTD